MMASASEVKKGEVRRLADAFPVTEAQRASDHVNEALRSHQQSLQVLRTYLRENQDLSKLVQELPNKVSHSIMVPFGKAAFFPGRLVHTNEFMVLLGEGYYAECSAKQTVEVLDRRSKYINSQIASVNTQLEDLHEESRFFKDTLAEAAAGVVEIREDFVEPSSSSLSHDFRGDNSERPGENVKGLVVGKQNLPPSKGDITGFSHVDIEHERLMARFNELEAAESAAGLDGDDNVKNTLDWMPDHETETECVPLSQHKSCQPAYKKDKDQKKLLGSFARKDEMLPKRKDEMLPNDPIADGLDSADDLVTNDCPAIRSPGDFVKFEEWRKFKYEKEEASRPRDMPDKEVAMEINVSNHPAAVSKEMSGPREMEMDVSNHPAPMHKETKRSKSFETSTAQKAFTGTVLERAGPSLPMETSQVSKQAQARPTSKFKMRQLGQ